MTANLITVYINDIEVKVLENSTVLQACEKAGIKVPRFCYHEKLSIAGNCRMCLVEIKNAPKLQASCALPVMKEARIYTDSIAVRKAREGIMELLLINHPLDCPICDQGGECDLQDQAMYYGSDHGRFNEYKRATSDKNFGPLIKTIMTRCIHCTRCVRFASEIAGCPELGTIGRGSNMEISTFVRSTVALPRNQTQPKLEDSVIKQSLSVLDSELSGNLIDLCPVGALTSLPYAFVARPWELTSVVSIDVSDTQCSDIKLDLRGQGPGSILRVLPATSSWISDKTRFSYDGLKRQRLINPLQKESSVSASQNSNSDLESKFSVKLWDELFDNSIKQSNAFGETSFDGGSQTLNQNLRAAVNQGAKLTIFLGHHIDLESLKTIQSYIKQTKTSVYLHFIHNDSNRYNNNLSEVSIQAYAEKITPNSQALAKEKEWLTTLNQDSFINEKTLEKAEVCLLVGTNPRLESPVLNASLQKVAKKGNVALFGSNSDNLPYPVKHLGIAITSLLTFINSSSENIKRKLKLVDSQTETPTQSKGGVNATTSRRIIIIGSSILYRKDAGLVLKELTKFASTYGFGKIKVLYQSVSELNALYTGLPVYDEYTTESVSKVKASEIFIYYNLPNYTLNNPLIKESLTGEKKLRIYVGSHGNELTNKCDFVLPTAAFTEKVGSYLTNSGKIKKTTVVTYPPGYALTDSVLFERLFS
jgi:NADH dehydrogenase/NADH:ubiquinone oxidoreductase subunit G